MKLYDLLEFDNIVIQCHNSPDADTIAAGFALYWYIKEHNKQVRLIYSGNEIISKSNMTLLITELNIPVEYVTELDFIPELLVTVDCVYGEGNVKRFKAKNIACIDHHRISGEPPAMSEIRSSYGSCSSVIASMLDCEGIDYTKDISVATALYYGLYMDTNGFGEIAHPNDRNLRDRAAECHSKPLMAILRNSILSAEEMEIAGDALHSCRYDDKLKYALVEARPCDPNILGFISDILLQVDSVNVCVVFSKISSGIKLSVRSCITEISAADFVRAITENAGSGGGHEQKAGGIIKYDIYELLYPGKAPVDFLRERITEYLSESLIIRAGEYSPDISDMKKYRKKKLTVGYVPSTDIVPEGTDILIRTLEGDISVRTANDVYIMIGILGEVYPIKKEKFERSYCPSSEPICLKTEYIPSIVEKPNYTVRQLTEYARGCTSQTDSRIWARQLCEPVRVYTLWDKDRYYRGRRGDYLAAQFHDTSDVYIIGKDVFDLLYEPEE